MPQNGPSRFYKELRVMAVFYRDGPDDFLRRKLVRQILGESTDTSHTDAPAKQSLHNDVPTDLPPNRRKPPEGGSAARKAAFVITLRTRQTVEYICRLIS